MSGKSQIFRERLMSWWQRWDSGYRGPMPYVVGPGYRVKSRRPRANWVYDLWRDWELVEPTPQTGEEYLLEC